MVGCGGNTFSHLRPGKFNASYKLSRELCCEIGASVHASTWLDYVHEQQHPRMYVMQVMLFLPTVLCER